MNYFEIQVEEPGEKVEKLSKKKLKLKNRMSVAELKQVPYENVTSGK